MTTIIQNKKKRFPYKIDSLRITTEQFDFGCQPSYILSINGQFVWKILSVASEIVHVLFASRTLGSLPKYEYFYWGGKHFVALSII